jgi:hypothetical protein
LKMNPIYIYWGLAALFVAEAVWLWQMPEKKWLNRMTVRNYFNIDFHKYNNKKVRTASVAFGFFEAACLFLLGLVCPEHRSMTLILLGCMVLAPIAYWPIFLVYCKKSKYKKKYKK